MNAAGSKTKRPAKTERAFDGSIIGFAVVAVVLDRAGVELGVEAQTAIAAAVVAAANFAVRELAEWVRERRQSD